MLKNGSYVICSGLKYNLNAKKSNTKSEITNQMITDIISRSLDILGVLLLRKIPVWRGNLIVLVSKIQLSTDVLIQMSCPVNSE